MKNCRRQATFPVIFRQKARQFAVFTSGLFLYLAIGTAVAQAQSDCDATYNFDGDLADSSGNGYDGAAFGRDNQQATPSFGEGIKGQALLFDGATGIATDLDLHFDRCPQVTITGWLRLNTAEPNASSYIFSVGSHGPLGAYLFHRTIVLRGRGNGLQIKNAMRDERAWFFFAGVYDFDAGTFRLQFRNRTVEGKLADKRRGPEGETYFGVRDSYLTSPAKDIFLDEVQIVGRALSDDEIDRIVARVTSRPSLTAIAHNAPRTGPPSSGSVSTRLIGPIDSGDPGNGLTMPESGVGPLNTPATADDYEAANDDPQTLDDLRDAVAERNPLADVGDEVADRVNENRPPDLSGGTGDGSGPDTETENNAPTTTIPHPVGVKQYSGVSGSRGDILRELELFNAEMTTAGTFNNAWLTDIRIGETSDRPCEVYVAGLRPIDYGNAKVHEQWEDDKLLAGCSAGNNIFSGRSVWVEMQQGSPRPQVGGDATAIGQVQICHNDRNNRRVKGLRINGARINADGTQTVDGNADASELTNCRKWAGAVICPANTMATGVVIHATEASGGNQQIVGLQLICREVSIDL